MQPANDAWRFEGVFDRSRLRRQLATGIAACLICAATAALAAQRDHLVLGTATLAAAILCGFSAVNAWRRLRSRVSPLSLDTQGVHVDDGLGIRWSVPWTELERVEVRREGIAKRIVLVLREPRGTRTLPEVCHGDAPPEWAAGLIRTFHDASARGFRSA